MFKSMIDHCYGLNVCVLPKFMLNCNAQCDGILRWELWEIIRSEERVIINGISALRKENPESSLIPSSM